MSGLRMQGLPAVPSGLDSATRAYLEALRNNMLELCRNVESMRSEIQSIAASLAAIRAAK